VTGIILSPWQLCSFRFSATFATMGISFFFERLKKLAKQLSKRRYHWPCPRPAASSRRKVGKPMDERIEAFLRDVLALEGEIWNLLRQGVRRHLAICEEQFRDAETNKRMKDRAAQACRTLCRARVAEEMRRRKGTSTAEHLKVVLSIIDTAALSQSNDD
jgi:hypothetical protein